MIKSFRHKELQRVWETGDVRGWNIGSPDRLQSILALLQAAETPTDMNLPGLRLHKMSGRLTGYWSVRLSGNWRVIFRFDEEGDACDVDLWSH